MRIRPAGVTPLELWDLPVDGVPLQAWRHHPAFPAVLARVVTELRECPPLRWPAQIRTQLRSVGAVYLNGGGCLSAGFTAPPELAGLAVRIAADPLFGPARAGTTLLQDRPGLCADVGQTAIKLSRGERTWSVPRDLLRAPHFDEVPIAERSAARASTVQFLAATLADAARAGDTLVVALPCEVTDEQSCRGCTYSWPEPDPDLVADITAAFDSVFVLNDAELAAVAASNDPLLPRHQTTLVLTIGYGVGGALLEPA